MLRAVGRTMGRRWALARVVVREDDFEGVFLTVAADVLLALGFFVLEAVVVEVVDVAPVSEIAGQRTAITTAARRFVILPSIAPCSNRRRVQAALARIPASQVPHY